MLQYLLNRLIHSGTKERIQYKACESSRVFATYLADFCFNSDLLGPMFSTSSYFRYYEIRKTITLYLVYLFQQILIIDWTYFLSLSYQILGQYNRNENQGLEPEARIRNRLRPSMAYQVTCLLSVLLNKADVPFFFFPRGFGPREGHPFFSPAVESDVDQTP